MCCLIVEVCVEVELFIVVVVECVCDEEVG